MALASATLLTSGCDTKVYNGDINGRQVVYSESYVDKSRMTLKDNNKTIEIETYGGQPSVFSKDYSSVDISFVKIEEKGKPSVQYNGWYAKKEDLDCSFHREGIAKGKELFIATRKEIREALIKQNAEAAANIK